MVVAAWRLHELCRQGYAVSHAVAEYSPAIAYPRFGWVAILESWIKIWWHKTLAVIVTKGYITTS